MTQLLEAMRATADWPAVRALRAWTRPALNVDPGDTVPDVGCGLADVLIDDRHDTTIAARTWRLLT